MHIQIVCPIHTICVRVSTTFRKICYCAFPQLLGKFASVGTFQPRFDKTKYTCRNTHMFCLEKSGLKFTTYKQH